MARPNYLIGDIGGTNARFAIARTGAPGFTRLRTLKVADFASLTDAIRFYLQATGITAPDVICIAAAGPVINQSVQFSNSSWSLTATGLRSCFDTERVLILNDFAAIAHALPFLQAGDLLQVGAVLPPTFDASEMMVGVVGAGTGLGAEGLRRHGEIYLPIDSEAPRCSFAPETDRQLEILSVLRERFGRVTSEHLVSGPGIENLYAALAQMKGQRAEGLSSAMIFAAHMANADPVATAAVDLFFEVLGQVAGDFVLTIGAFDGMFIAGGIAQRHPELLLSSRFREAFERKGDYSRLMKPVPVALITHPQPGLLGAACCALTLAAS